MVHRHLLVSLAALVLWASPAFATSLSPTLSDVVMTWVFGVSYIAVVVALVWSFGLGWWSFGRSVSAFCVLALLDLSVVKSDLIDGPFARVVGVVILFFVPFVLGGAWLGWALFKEVVRPARESFVVWARCRWIHRAHALWLCFSLLLSVFGLAYAGWEDWIDPLLRVQPLPGNSPIY